VIVSGRWRRQLNISGTTACQNTALPATFAVMPQNQSQGDIPKIAIATGSVDQVECVLRKVGISDLEFTDPIGTGRINFYTGAAALALPSIQKLHAGVADGECCNARSVRRADVALPGNSQ